ncbi:hypothetical protein EIP91_007763 [Steccherinum ochraceum]|uniref:Uncharacterized protein n=1 Tax=Steccherinum ochraceum TaxID=92696 RepID=A0A4R0RP09_9APHY|nr:hypothetical protein EIP91_007763 [Steccherinum ochraceum]
MKSLRSRATRFRAKWLPSDSLSQKGIPSLRSVKPLYERRPVWWTRWTYPLVCANLIVTAYACELTWNYWTEVEKKPVSKIKGKDKAQDTDGDEERKWVLRPVWQRASFAGGQMLLGVALSALILGAASRQVRRLYVVPTPKSLLSAEAANKPSKSLIVQTVHHLDGRGKIIPMDVCTLRKGRGEKEIVVAPEGYTGTFWVDLVADAKVGGREMSTWNMRQTIYKAFYGAEWSKVLNEHGWVKQ